MDGAHGKQRLRWRVRSLLCWSLVCATLGQAGCTTGIAEFVHNGFKVGPNYHPPEAPLPAKWIDVGRDPRVSVGEANLASWWEVFDDPILNKLIQQTYSRNLTVREAGVLIQQSQIQRNIALSELLPQAQTMVAGYNRGEASQNNGTNPGLGATAGASLTPSAVVGFQANPSTPIAGAATEFSLAGTTTTGTSPLVNGFAGGGGGGAPSNGSRFFSNWGTSANLSWELDFWGLFRRNLEAASASLEQSMHNYDELIVQLLANVATQYIEVRTFQKRLALARQNVLLQEPLVAKLKEQYETGIANSKPSYFQLKSNLDNTRALIPPLEASLRQANNQLCDLLGVPMHDLLPELGDGFVPDPKDPKKQMVRIPRAKDDSVVLTIPGDTLLRRPDVLALEDQLRIQSAQIGIAEAQMFPHIGLNGNVGLAADRLGKVFNQQSWIGNIGPSLTWNILDYGRLLANVNFQNKQYQQFVLAYQQGILNANQDAENSIVAYLQALEQTRYLQASADDSVETTKYYYTQLAEGYLPPAATSQLFYNTIFTAVNFQVTQQDAAATAEGNIALNLILLYRALGGGWQIRHNNPDGPDLNNCGGEELPKAPMPRVLPDAQGAAKPSAPTSWPPANVVAPTKPSNLDGQAAAISAKAPDPSLWSLNQPVSWPTSGTAPPRSPTQAALP